MPHAVEIILARPATPGELRHARRSVPVAANADRTRLMAVQYALASPTTYTDPTGNNPMIAIASPHGLMDGGLDWLTQRLSGRKVNWGQVGQSAAIGCLSGMLGEGLGAMFEGRLGSKLGSCSLPNSFTGDTPVLMADGTRKPIKDVEVGDTILATDPETGDTGPRKVTALIKGDGDKQLVDITLDTDGLAGTKTGTITATDGHPFWEAGQHTESYRRRDRRRCPGYRCPGHHGCRLSARHLHPRPDASPAPWRAGRLSRLRRK